MRRFFQSSQFALIAGMFFLAAPQAGQAEDLKFVLINKSHAPIAKFFVSAANHDEWEENRFPANAILPVGNKLDIHIVDKLTSCEYDVKAVFKDGSFSEDFDVDLCKLNKGTYTYTK